MRNPGITVKQQPAKRHHIVPKLYLRRFADEERITAIEIETGLILENQDITNVAFEKHANRPEGVLVDRGVDAECQISAVESGFAEALRDFPDKFPPSSELRKTVSDFVLFQIVRDPKKLAQYDDGEEEGTSLKDHRLVALGLLLNDPNDPARRRVLEDSGLLEFREDVQADINERCWLLYEAPAGGTAEFITSDSPVHLAGGVPDEGGLIRHADVHQLLLPLDRRHLLIMEQGSPADDRRVKAGVSQVLELNRKIVQSARRFAYAHPTVNRRWLQSSVRRQPSVSVR